MSEIGENKRKPPIPSPPPHDNAKSNFVYECVILGDVE